jgi:hypothetical protein
MIMGLGLLCQPVNPGDRQTIPRRRINRKTFIRIAIDIPRNPLDRRVVIGSEKNPLPLRSSRERV